MKLYSTNNPALRVDFKEAVFNSLPADQGLYMPVDIPRLPASFTDNLDKHSFGRIAFTVCRHLLGDAIPENRLETIIDDAVNFPAPLVALDEQTFVLELFHGPSLAFKDFGARFMSRVMGYYLEQESRPLDVLVATSGDTGGAVALGFLNVPGIRVTILYPKGKVSTVQERQLTGNGGNIRALEVEGTFDDCQALVKQAFSNPILGSRLNLTSANSINIARLIPQTFYYFEAAAQLQRRGITKPVFSVPSGNFGNLSAGLLAWRMGLPVRRFVAATNTNDTVPLFFETGEYCPKASQHTLSNAMDVGNPSNWVRVLELLQHDTKKLKGMVSAYSFSDLETLSAIQQIFAQSGYIACPHTAVAWLGLKRLPENSPGVLLATAHPCKFPDVYPGFIGKEIHPPQGMAKEKKNTERIPVDFERLKEYLLA